MGIVWITFLATLLGCAADKGGESHAPIRNAAGGFQELGIRFWRSRQAQQVQQQLPAPAEKALTGLHKEASVLPTACKNPKTFVTIDPFQHCDCSTSHCLAYCLANWLERASTFARQKKIFGVNIHLQDSQVLESTAALYRRDRIWFKQIQRSNLFLSVSLSLELGLRNVELLRELFSVFDYVNIVTDGKVPLHYSLPEQLSWITSLQNFQWAFRKDFEDLPSSAPSSSYLGDCSTSPPLFFGLLTHSPCRQRIAACAVLWPLELEDSSSGDNASRRSVLQTLHVTDLGDNITAHQFNVTAPPGVHDIQSSASVTARPPNRSNSVAQHEDPNWLAITIIPGLAVVSLMVLAFRRLLYPRAHIDSGVAHKDAGTNGFVAEQQMSVLNNSRFLKLLCHVQPAPGANWVSNKTQILNRSSLPLLLLKVPQGSSQGSSSHDVFLENGFPRGFQGAHQDIKQDDVNMAIDLTADIELAEDSNALLGQGAYGWVYKGYYKGHPVAVKLLSRMFKEGYIPPQDLAQFEQEMQILSQVRHENIVHLFGGCLIPPNIFLVEELLEFSLADYVHGRRSPMSLPELLAIIRGVAKGLCVLHPGIIHRDLKPGNVLLDRHGSIKISDFGLARAKITSYLSTQNLMAGTIPYMAPECFNSQRGVVTEKSDIYSLAIIMVECLTGRPPWEGWDSFAILYQVAAQAKRPRIPDDPSICPMQLRSLIQDCWKTNPHERPSAEEVVERVEAMQQQLHAELDSAHVFEQPLSSNHSHQSVPSSDVPPAPLQDAEEDVPHIPAHSTFCPEPMSNQASTPHIRPTLAPLYTNYPAISSYASQPQTSQLDHAPQPPQFFTAHMNIPSPYPIPSPPSPPTNLTSLPSTSNHTCPSSSPAHHPQLTPQTRLTPPPYHPPSSSSSDTHPDSCGSDVTLPLLNSPPPTTHATPVTSPCRTRATTPEHSAPNPNATPATPSPSRWPAAIPGLTRSASRQNPPRSGTATPSRSPSTAYRELFPVDPSCSPSSYIRDRPDPSVLHALMVQPQVLRSPPQVRGAQSPVQLVAARTEQVQQQIMPAGPLHQCSPQIVPHRSRIVSPFAGHTELAILIQAVGVRPNPGGGYQQ